MIRVIRNVKDGLNVWADNKKNTQCYASNEELVGLFFTYLLDTEQPFNDVHIQDFIDTFHRLDEFYFEATDEGLCYYRPKAEVK